MRNLRIGFIAAAIAAAAAGLWSWQAGSAGSALPPLELSRSRVSLIERANPTALIHSKTAPTLTIPIPANAAELQAVKDWYALAKNLLPGAQAHDPKAQYLLFKAYHGCVNSSIAHGYDLHPTFESLHEQLTERGSGPDFIDRAESQYRQCQGFYSNDIGSFGDPWDWLQQATDAGYPPAQAETARERLMQDQEKALMHAGAVPGDLATLPPIGGDADPRELLGLAAQSGDPAALIEVGFLQHTLNPTQPIAVTKIETLAWQYAGCQRLGDCSAYFGPGTIQTCPPNAGNCTPVPNAFLNQMGGNWAPVQERVDQINAALAAHQLGQFGLGS